MKLVIISRKWSTKTAKRKAVWEFLIELKLGL